eukprot:COSAG04_NODE_1903_length_5262_cov_2.214604_5_plen_240_part_00
MAARPAYASPKVGSASPPPTAPSSSSRSTLRLRLRPRLRPRPRLRLQLRLQLRLRPRRRRRLRRASSLRVATPSASRRPRYARALRWIHQRARCAPPRDLASCLPSSAVAAADKALLLCRCWRRVPWLRCSTRGPTSRVCCGCTSIGDGSRPEPAMAPSALSLLTPRLRLRPRLRLPRNRLRLRCWTCQLLSSSQSPPPPRLRHPRQPQHRTCRPPSRARSRPGSPASRRARKHPTRSW